MEILKTISKYHRVFDTNQKPMLFTCNDFNEYIVKHQRGSIEKIFIEFAVSIILKYFDVPTPNFAIVKVNKNHINNDNLPVLPYHFIDKPCFGSLFDERANEFDNRKMSIKNNDSHYLEQFFKIALIDLIIVNNDRHFGNSNLLYYKENNNINLVAIDHEQCFDGLLFNRIDITIDETILGNYNYSKQRFQVDCIAEERKKVIMGFKQKSVNCVLELEQELQNLEKALNINTSLIPEILKYFEPNWLNTCFKHFEELTEFYRKK